MLKEIPKSDIVSRPIKLYKEWTLDHNDVPPIFGENPAGSFVDVDSDDKSHGYVKKVIYASIESQFYRNSATASILTEVGRRESYASSTERVFLDVKKIDGAIMTRFYPAIHRTILYKKQGGLFMITVEKGANLSDVEYKWFDDADIIFDSEAKS